MKRTTECYSSIGNGKVNSMICTSVERILGYGVRMIKK